MRPTFVDLPKLTPGDRVAVVTPAWRDVPYGDEIRARALDAVRDLGLEPVASWHAFRSQRGIGMWTGEVQEAFADPDIRAVFATSCGSEVVQALPRWDPAVFTTNPKPFVGYSGNTSILNWLWNLGLPSFHGGCPVGHLSLADGIHPMMRDSLRAALFEGGDLDLHPADEFVEDDLCWATPDFLNTSASKRPGEGWSWHQPERVVTGRMWGGSLEVVHRNLAINRWMRPVEDYAGCVLLLETSDAVPGNDEVAQMIVDLGERELLAQFPAIIVGLAKAANCTFHPDEETRRDYRIMQQHAFLYHLETYAPDTMVVFGVDVGHTTPQWVLPYGGQITVDGPARRIVAHYGGARC